jgi:hypothetical protein
LLRELLAAMSYFGRAESWIDAELLDANTVDADVTPCELGESPPTGRELVRRLVPVLPANHADWARNAPAGAPPSAPSQRGGNRRQGLV